MRNDRRGGSPGDAPAKDQHKEQIQPDVQQRRRTERGKVVTLIMQLLIRIRRMADSGDAAAQSEAHYDPKIAQVMSYINENLCGELSVDVLAERVFLSKYHFMRLFKAQTGVTVHTYVRQKRLVNAARLIREGTPAAKAAADSGFTDYSAFHRAFRESFGMSPGKLKK